MKNTSMAIILLFGLGVYIVRVLVIGFKALKEANKYEN